MSLSIAYLGYTLLRCLELDGSLLILFVDFVELVLEDHVFLLDGGKILLDL